jgi:large subunit ribosomal protein L6
VSRVGKQPIKIPSGVTITVGDQDVTVQGPKGSLSQPLFDGINVTTIGGDFVEVSRVDDEWLHKSQHGLMRTLISNMITGVTEGYKKQLEITGVGFRAASAGAGLKLNIGLSHEVQYNLPQGVTATVDQNIITVSGINKQQVGQVAAEIRALKKPEPYKGKGIKYVGERILRKSGKSGKEK